MLTKAKNYLRLFECENQPLEPVTEKDCMEWLNKQVIKVDVTGNVLNINNFGFRTL